MELALSPLMRARWAVDAQGAAVTDVSPEAPDDALMAAAQAGSERAFEWLVRRHLGPLSRYCAKFTGDRARGEDLAQETLVALWHHRARYRGDGRFKVYLFTLARNRCRNAQRDAHRQQARAEAAAAPEAPPRANTPLELRKLIEDETTLRVQAVMGALPDKLREALLLRFDQGLDYAAIGRIIGRPEATARTRVFHGLKKLRELLQGRIDR